MINVIRCYAPAWPLLAWAVLIQAGVDPVRSLVPFLLVEAAAIIVYLHWRFETARKRRGRR